MLTKRERVHASINRGAFDAIPWQFDLTSSLAQKVRAYYHTDDLLAATDDHIILVGQNAPAGTDDTPAEPGIVANEFGTVWRREPRDAGIGDWGEIVSYPLKAPCLDGYRFPDGSTPGRWESIKYIRAKYPDHFVAAVGSGLFESAWALCGFERYLDYVAGEQDFVEELTDLLVEYSCAVTSQLKGLGIDGIRFGDDWGFQDRLMMHPNTWRRLYKERYRRIYAAGRDAGLVVMIHSCGNITDILPDLIDVGVQVIHPLQPEAMDVTHCQREFGNDLTFWGGLGSQSTLPCGSPEDVRAEVLDRLELFAAGGYILAPAGAAPTETPVENIAAIVEAARAQLGVRSEAQLGAK
ncbi:MAG: uroporphyrinogen decarboxylase family protein [Armatimonadota bacterium]